MSPPTFTFRVLLSEDPPTWLTTDQGATPDEAAAVVFRFRSRSTFADDCRMEMALDEIAGGVAQVVDLTAGLDATNARILVDARALWKATHTATSEAAELFPSAAEPSEPNDEPEPTPEEVAAIIDAATLAPQDPRYRTLARLIAGYERMDNLLASMRLAASWPLLIVDPPLGWEDFGAKPMSETHKRAVVRAYAAARRAVEAPGKG